LSKNHKGAAFRAELEVRSKRHRYDPKGPIKPEVAPFDVHAERAAAYVELRRQFPEARDRLHSGGIGLAHRRFSLTGWSRRLSRGDRSGRRGR
jgi:hypothetical protein